MTFQSEPSQADRSLVELSNLSGRATSQVSRYSGFSWLGKLAHLPEQFRQSLLTIICCLFLVVSAASYSQSTYAATNQSSQNSSSDGKKQQLEQLKRQINQLKKKLKETRQQYRGEQRSLQQNEIQIAKLSRQLDKLNLQLKDSDKQIKQLRSQRNQMQGKVSQQKQQLAQQLESAWQNGSQEQLKLMLNQQDPQKVGRMLVWYDYFNKARVKAIADLQQSQKKLKQTETLLAEKQLNLRQLRQQQSSDKQQLDQQAKQRKTLLAKLNKQLKSQKSHLSQKQTDQKALQKLIDTLQISWHELNQQINKKPFRKLKGKMKWPVSGNRLNNYNSWREKGQLRWKGIRIAANAGRNVRAISHGRVVFADWLRGFGLLLILDHGDGYMTLYGYNQSLNKEVGDWVNARDVLATVGQSGGQKRNALYFEMRKNGKPFNPVGWVR
ncbi:murein hydrolase activator EnvC family protein [Pelagibaculum spongiae]|uniref:ATPase n=1 Tax=Pelagibaculum spongiae TaxID=2080658 RepID=A0A2V1GZA0_9GAMM|nr:peptidoglycan DD-metalloendopeptidase family protein [Pelagibaculum spongiae]PVZ68133.1 ATPase [Pelagibaculum spongiae]